MCTSVCVYVCGCVWIRVLMCGCGFVCVYVRQKEAHLHLCIHQMCISVCVCSVCVCIHNMCTSVCAYVCVCMWAGVQVHTLVCGCGFVCVYVNQDEAQLHICIHKTCE